MSSLPTLLTSNSKHSWILSFISLFERFGRVCMYQHPANPRKIITLCADMRGQHIDMTVFRADRLEEWETEGDDKISAMSVRITLRYRTDTIPRYVTSDSMCFIWIYLLVRRMRDRHTPSKLLGLSLLTHILENITSSDLKILGLGPLFISVLLASFNIWSY